MTSSAATALPDDLLHTPAFRRDPFPAWRRLRHEAPIWYDRVADRWVVTRYQLARLEIATATRALLERWPRFDAVDEPAFGVELELMRHVRELRLRPR